MRCTESNRKQNDLGNMIPLVDGTHSIWKPFRYRIPSIQLLPSSSGVGVPQRDWYVSEVGKLLKEGSVNVGLIRWFVFKPPNHIHTAACFCELACRQCGPSKRSRQRRLDDITISWSLFISGIFWGPTSTFRYLHTSLRKPCLLTSLPKYKDIFIKIW